MLPLICIRQEVREGLGMFEGIAAPGTRRQSLYSGQDFFYWGRGSRTRCCSGSDPSVSLTKRSRRNVSVPPERAPRPRRDNRRHGVKRDTKEKRSTEQNHGVKIQQTALRNREKRLPRVWVFQGECCCKSNRVYLPQSPRQLR